MTGGNIGEGAEVETVSKTGGETEVETEGGSTGIEIKRETVEAQMTVLTGEREKSQEVENEAQSQQIKVRKSLTMIAAHIAVTNTPKRAKRRARRSTRRKAICLKGQLHLESQKRRRSQRRRQQVTVQHQVPVESEVKRSIPRKTVTQMSADGNSNFHSETES